MNSLFLLACLLALLLFCLPCLAGQKKAAQPEKPAFIASVEKISRGTTFQCRDARNVSFTLSPVRAFITISF